jgi:RNA polymerase sigma-70 factor (ECF subfamily)
MDDGARDAARPNLRLVGGSVAARLPAVVGAREEEGALAAAFLAGDYSPLERVAASSSAAVLRIVRRYARTPEDARALAEDAFGRAFTAARRALSRDPQRAVPIRRWILRAALKAARHHLRREVCVAGARLEQLGPGEPSPPGDGGACLRAERVARARREVLQLPRRLRDVLTLRLDPELAFAQIAKVLEITEVAAVLSFHDAVRRLRDAFPSQAPVDACAGFEVLLSSRVAGGLERGESARVDAHVAGCAACRAVSDATADVLSLAALEPERRADEHLATRAIAAFQRAERRRVAWRRALVAVAIGAVSALAAATALLGHHGGPH